MCSVWYKALHEVGDKNQVKYCYYSFLNKVLKLDIYTNMIRLEKEMVFLNMFLIKTPLGYFLETRH